MTSVQVVCASVREKLNFCEVKKDFWSNMVSVSRNWIHPLCLNVVQCWKKNVLKYQLADLWAESSKKLKNCITFLFFLFSWQPKTVVPGLTERLGAKWPDVLHDLLSSKRATGKKISTKRLNWQILALRKRKRERDLKEGHGLTWSKCKAGGLRRNSWESVKTQQSHFLSRTTEFLHHKL